MNPPKKKPGFFDNADGTTSVAKVLGAAIVALVIILAVTGGNTKEQEPAAIMAIGALVLAVTWIIFPFIVISKFNELIRINREILTELKTNHESRKAGTEKAAPPPLPKAEQDVYRID
jgi:hypothetical protein